MRLTAPEQNPPSAAARFTPEIHATIAGFLAGTNAFRSLASYNIANRATYQATLPALFEVVVLDGPLPASEDEESGTGKGSWTRRGVKRNRGWRYTQYDIVRQTGGAYPDRDCTRYLIVSEEHAKRFEQLLGHTEPGALNTSPDSTFRQTLLRAFPRLRMHLEWSMKPSATNAKQVRRTGSLVLLKSIDFEILHQLLRNIHLHVWRSNRPLRRTLDSLVDVRYAAGVKSLNDGPVLRQQRNVYWNTYADDLTVSLEEPDGKTIPTAIPDLVQQSLRFQRSGRNTDPNKPNGPQFLLRFPKVQLGGMASIFDRVSTIASDHP